MASIDRKEYKIGGMDCAEEVAILKRELVPILGNEDRLQFDVLNARMSVLGEFDEPVVLKAIARTGMSATVWSETPSEDPVADSVRFGRTGLTILSGVLLAVAFGFHSVRDGFSAATEEGGLVPVLSKGLYLLSILAGGWFIFPKALFALRRLRPDMNLLMVVAVVGAIAINQWLEAATVTFLFAVSIALEAWSVGRAKRAVAKLLELTPAQVCVVENGQEKLLPPNSVPVGAEFVVRPGDRIALDGTVVDGLSDVNQAPITGESVPVSKGPNDVVFAGTINGDGALRVRSTKAATDTTLAKIIRMVGQAQSRRAPSEQWVERFARVYTPVVMLGAILFLLIPPLFFNGEWGKSIYNALAMLVIACPCALVISTPVSIVAALAAAAKNGVLVKGGLFIELPGGLKAIALDKTGTLTEGKPKVVEIVPLSGHSEDELLSIAASMEGKSSHPLAVAIVDAAQKRGIRATPAEDFQTIQGKGATGKVGGKLFWLGSHRYLEERKQETDEVHQRIEAITARGRTIVAVGEGDHLCGLIALEDAVRPNARKAVEDLHALGVRPLVMLTGDNRATAERVTKETSVDEFRAELLPEDKVTAVEGLVAEYGRVAMIGDGVNDAPAMARATFGIAMGAVGSDAAIETADIALMSDDLSKLPWLVRHSRRTLRVIRQNILFALSVKAIFVILTLLGHSSLWGAIAADTGASLLVVFNGLRLLVVRADQKGAD